MKKKTSKFKEGGRPEGSPNAKSLFVRDVRMSFRATEGLDMTLKALIASGNYKSKADVIHEAVQMLALRKLQDSNDLFWVNKIQ